MVYKIYKGKTYSGRNKCKKNCKVHISMKSLINKNGDECRKGNYKGCNTENHFGIFGGEIQILGQICRKPENYRGSYNPRYNGNKCKLNYFVFNKYLDAAALFFGWGILIVFYNALLFHNRKDDKAADTHKYEYSCA